MVGERRPYALGLHRPAADRDHGGRPGKRLEDDLLLMRTERGLALAVEELLDRLAQALDEHAVGVDRSELPGKRGLARPHEADQDECHPMRSS